MTFYFYYIASAEFTIYLLKSLILSYLVDVLKHVTTIYKPLLSVSSDHSLVMTCHISYTNHNNKVECLKK